MLNTEWRKSTKSGNSGACVEARLGHDGRVQVRDSKDPDGPVLTFDSSAWDAFLAGVKDGEFEL